MREFASERLADLKRSGVDGFILKSRSPSCGVSDTKYFTDWVSEDALALGSGLFARAVSETFPDLPVEDETRLENRENRRVFLERVFERAGRREGILPPGRAGNPPFPADLL
jgi:hypothetical protein